MRNEDLKKYVSEISDKYNLKKVILFGSRARGNHKKNSDIDLLVEYNTPTVSVLKTVGLMQDIEAKFGLKVDIVRYPIVNRGIKLIIDKEVHIYG